MIALSREERLARADLLRRAAAAGGPEVNGIVSLEVHDVPSGVMLQVEFVFDLPTSPGNIGAANIKIDGGVRRPEVAVRTTQTAGNMLRVYVARRGDFSLYRFAVVNLDGAALQLDPLMSQIEFGFRLGCETAFDCQADEPVEIAPLPRAPVDYRARDYAGFRRLMTDRMAQLMPGWRDKGAASPDIALVEMLAHVADRLAYAQDAVATEAYLDTARLRLSAKRHAKLVGYRMHDGCNARGFVHVTLREGNLAAPPVEVTVRAGARFMTLADGAAVATGETSAVSAARTAGAQVFEAMADARLLASRNRIVLHDYDGALDELPRGTTALALADPGRRLALEAGDFLLLEQVADPVSGDATMDLDRRHIVRLTNVTESVDPVGGLNADGEPVPLELLEVEWAPADALPARWPVARVRTNDRIDGIEPGPDQPSLVARGNLVLVDHGESAGLETVRAGRKRGRRRVVLTLEGGPVTQAVPLNSTDSVAKFMAGDAADAVPQVGVRQMDGGGGAGRNWLVKRDLLDSEPSDRHFVYESVEGDRGQLRSGDGEAGDIPPPDVDFALRYRIGNGPRGHVAAGAIAHVLTDPHIGLDATTIVPIDGQVQDILALRNPLPTGGALAPQTIPEVRRMAPTAFQDDERAVTPADYARRLEELPEVQAARGVSRWNGSWRVIVLLVDRVDGDPLDEGKVAAMRSHLEHFRLAGHDLAFRDPKLVPLELELRVCVEPGVVRTDVEEELLALFGRGTLPDGTQALFHPDRLSFGEELHLSPIIAAAQNLPGVRHVELVSVARQGEPRDAAAIAEGVLRLGTYEIPVLDNDPNYPDRGVLKFRMEGGA